MGEELAGWCRRRLGVEPVAAPLGRLAATAEELVPDGDVLPPAPGAGGSADPAAVPGLGGLGPRPARAVAAARRPRRRPRRPPGPGLAPVVGHADWKSQNIRWRGDRPLAVHDWDSAVAQPEPVVAGLAAAVWPADGTPDRAATLQQTEQFVAAYEQARGRPWTPPSARPAGPPASGWGPSTPRRSACPAAAPAGASRRRGGRTRRQGRSGGGGGRVAWAQGRVAGEVGVAWA